MIHPADLTALWLTVKLALVSTAVLLVLGTPLGWWLATTRRRSRPVIDALVALPWCCRRRRRAMRANG